MSLNADGALTMRTFARTLIAASFFFAGLAETLSATGLVLELSPRMFWGLEPHTVPLGGPVQIAGAVLLVSGRKTAWALGLLLCYLILGTVFGNLPHLLSPVAGDAALAGLVSNMAVVGGMIYWLHTERAPRRPRSRTIDLLPQKTRAAEVPTDARPAETGPPNVSQMGKRTLVR